MNIEDVPDGSRVFVDANIILYALDHKSGSCRRFLARCQAQAVTGLITTVTLAEVAHRRMVEEARAKGLAGSNPARTLSQRPELVRGLGAYAEDVRDLMAGELGLENVRLEDFPVALELQRRHGLLTNDSLNLAVCQRLGLTEIATADNCFDAIPGLAVYKPADRTPAAAVT
jgi:predicted nucleic acid-binding protein